MPAEALLRTRVVSASYGRAPVLHDVNMEVAAGELVVVLGSNGAGKTTLLRSISGVLVRTEAEIVFAGASVDQVSAHQRVALGIAHVPENRRVFADLTVLENLRIGAHVRRRQPDAGAVLERVFELFPRLRERTDQYAGTLSGGEQQMLAIGRGLMSAPRLLMVDEASLGLSPVATTTTFEALRQIADGGTAVLLVEQNARASLRVADRGYVLDRGRVVLQGGADELAAHPELVAAYLGEGQAGGPQLIVEEEQRC